MKKSREVHISASSLRNILTFRYDTSLQSNLPSLAWSDFLNSNERPTVEFIENELKKSLEESFSKSTKNVSC